MKPISVVPHLRPGKIDQRYRSCRDPPEKTRWHVIWLLTRPGPSRSARCHGSASGQIVRRFADRFRTKHWPKDHRLPEIFFDPRSLEIDATKKACLHAKCVVTDLKQVFVSSANFTEAAQERNLEVGLLVRSSHLATRLADHFESLVSSNRLQRAS